MALPFAMMTSADVTVPDVPTYTGDAKVYYAVDKTAAGGNTVVATDAGGATPEIPLKGSSTNLKAIFAAGGAVANGGVIVVNGKFNVGTDIELEKNTAPVIITAQDGSTNYTSVLPADENALVYTTEGSAYNPFKAEYVGNYNTWDGKGKASSGQYGMFMMASTKSLTINGTIIFDKIVILNRAGTATTTPGTFNIKNGAAMVIKNTVDFVEMAGEVMYHVDVAEGGYLYLDKLGFDNYTGAGTIVVGSNILDAVQAAGKDATFPNFTGNIVKQDGSAVFAAAPADTTTTSSDTTSAPADTTTAAPADTTTAAPADTTAAPADTTAAPADTTAATETTTAAPEKIEVPAKPTATQNKVVYVAHDKNEAGTDIGKTEADGDTQPGDTPTYAYKTSAASKIEELFATGALKDGGKIVIVGKFLVNPAAAAPTSNKITLAATTSPVVITANDGTTNFTSMKDGAIYFMNDTKGNAGQFGMFMLGEGKEVTINGDVIFDDVVILSRQSEKSVTDGKAAGKLIVNKTLTVTSTVKFANMGGEQNYDLVVNEGAYAYLDANGFKSITGKGTLVIGENLKKTVKAADFAGFDGYVVDEQGNHLFADNNNNTGNNSNTGDATLALAAVLAVSAVACGAVLTFKKSRV